MSLELSGRIGRAYRLRAGWFKPATAATPTPQPTTTHGKSTVFYVSVNGTPTNVSSYLKHLELNRKAYPHKTTSLTSTSEQYIPGPTETKIPFNGFFDPSIANYLEQSTQLTFSLYPAGTATGQYQFSGTADISAKATQSETSKANEIEGELTMSGSPVVTLL
jgi:hypothetical protein